MGDGALRVTSERERAREVSAEAGRAAGGARPALAAELGEARKPPGQPAALTGVAVSQ